MKFIDKVIEKSPVRQKRKLTKKIVSRLSDLTESLDTKSCIVIYTYIQENLPNDPLVELSYSSIRRALKP